VDDSFKPTIPSGNDWNRRQWNIIGTSFLSQELLVSTLSGNSHKRNPIESITK